MKYHQLILFNDYLNNNAVVTRDGLKDLLKLSSRQITRKLKDWSDEGIIKYEMGVGRGNFSKIEVLFDVEQAFLNYFLSNFNQYTPSEINDILSWPLSPATDRIIRNYIHDEIYEELKPNKLIYTDYIYRIPDITNEASIYDSSLQLIVKNVGLRLFEKNGQSYESKIIKYYEVDRQLCMVYLYKNIYFSNGHILSAIDVVNILNQFLDKKLGGVYRKFIKEISMNSKYSFKIVYNSDFSLVQHIFSDLSATIYKLDHGNPISVGPYQVDAINNNYIVLKKNEYFTSYESELDEVYLINDFNRYFEQYNYKKKISTNDFFKYRFLMKNPNKTIDDSTINNIKVDIKNILSEQQVNKHKDSINISILFVENISVLMQKIIYKLIELNYNVQVEIVSIEEFLSLDIEMIHTDLIYMTELLEKNMSMFDLYTNSIASRWFDSKDIYRNVINKFINTDISEWNNINSKIEQSLVDDGNIIPISKNSYETMIAEDYNSIEEMRYGIKDFSKFIKIGR